MSPSSRWERLAPLTGVVFVALAIVSIILSGSTPDSTDTTAGVVGFWQAHDSREMTSGLLGALAVVFFLWFLGSLRSALGRSERQSERLATTVFAGFLVFAVGLLSILGFQFAAADVADNSGVAPEVVGTLSVLQSDFFFPLSVGLIVGFLSSAVAIWRYGAFPRWLAYLAIVAAILFVTPAFFVGLPLAGIWVLVVSVLMYQEAGAPRPQTP
jgi:hypothetical protein